MSPTDVPSATALRADQIRSGELILACADLAPTVSFFTKRLGFRVDAISPADAPTSALLSGFGVRIRLDPTAATDPGSLRLGCALAPGEAVPEPVVAPNGTRVEFVDADPPLSIPDGRQSFVVNRLADHADFGVGRAGMRYRDLIPDRFGGRFIASHIAIPDGGPVPDYVHFHKIRFQMIFCRAGWVKVVYEDQGPPFVLEAGDCVLQPPEIRHRVLEASPGLEVVELACPATHQTLADHEITLPTAELRPDRDFGGQRFVRHVASAATWAPWRHPGFEYSDLGLQDATGGIAGVRVVRSCGASATPPGRHDAELLFTFVLAGGLTVQCAGQPAEALEAGDSFTIPAESEFSFAGCSADVSLLEVSLPPLPR